MATVKQRLELAEAAIQNKPPALVRNLTLILSSSYQGQMVSAFQPTLQSCGVLR